ncbi:DUF6416 domain-containing protein [Streptomyces canus]|uniref:DUF6416 domain-containing protein n=1 Tax=Streptomyces canus TaxID=58343 RepID=UPI00386B8B8E|nr:DUF6416 domain-containing protein [Streptomyces canus]
MTKPDGRPLRLAGIAEAAAIYQADKSQTRRLLARDGAPRPIDTIAVGPIYDRDALEHHASSWSRKPGRPKHDEEQLPVHLDDADPMWDKHDGGSGHHGPDWQPTDHAQAAAYYQALSKTAQEIFDHLRATPGRLVSCDEIAERFNLNPDGTKNNPNVVAGYMNTTGRARKEAGRRFPFRWWETSGGAHYAVKECVADLFGAALKAKTPVRRG